jgi:type VI secretion system secreted protein Hcp
MPSDYYLLINTVEGESQNANFPKYIELDSYSFGASNPADVGGKGLSDFSFTCALDSASWQIVKDLYSGTHIDQCTFAGCKAGGDKQTYKYIEVTLTNCYITSHSTGGGSQGVPSQSVSIAYEQILYNYFTQKTEDGTTVSAGTATYNIGTGVAS